MIQPRTKLLHVEALRAFAALFVVVTHALHEVSEIFAGHARYFDEKIFPGDFGVDVFFIISGFVMVYVSADKFGTAGSATVFLRRRFIRIAPLYWLMTSVVLLIVLAAPSLMDNAPKEPLHWLASYAFFPMARETDGLIRPLLGVGWTLQYEMFFYLLFALALWLPRGKAVAAVVMAITAMVISGRLGETQSTLATFASDPIMLEFAAGSLLGLAYLNGVRITSLAFWPMIIVALFALSLMPAFTQDMEIWRALSYGTPALMIVAACVLTRKVQVRPVPRLMVSLGASSYALYLVHPFVLGVLKVLWTKLGLTALVGFAMAPWAFLTVTLIICPIVGHVLHLVFEKPITRKLNSVRWGKHSSDLRVGAAT
ncbi:MAG: acyltransferase [Pseudomonadota bacterium]